MPRWLPDDFDPDAHNARVQSLRSRMRADDNAHRVSTSCGVESRHATPTQAFPSPAPNEAQLSGGTHQPIPRASDGAGVAPGPLTHSKSVMKRLTALGLQDNPAALAANALTHQRAKADGDEAHTPDRVNGPGTSHAASSAPIYPLVGLCRAAGLPEPIPEYRFHYQRKWRADYAWPIHKVIVEIDGGLFVQGRHSRGAGQLADMEKLNAAAMLGYAVLRYSPQQLGRAIADLRIMFAKEAA